MATNQSIMGSLHETAKHFGGWQTRHSEACRKTKRLFHSKTDILTFQGPTALFAIKQGVFFIPCDRFLTKGSLQSIF